MVSEHSIRQLNPMLQRLNQTYAYLVLLLLEEFSECRLVHELLEIISIALHSFAVVLFEDSLHLSPAHDQLHDPLELSVVDVGGCQQRLSLDRVYQSLQLLGGLDLQV